MKLITLYKYTCMAGLFFVKINSTKIRKSTDALVRLVEFRTETYKTKKKRYSCKC